MPETHRENPHAAVALLSEECFELRTPNGQAVPLRFEPDATYVMWALLLSDGVITTGNISREHEFRSIVPDTQGARISNYEAQVVQHARVVASHLLFTFNALSSTPIQVDRP